MFRTLSFRFGIMLFFIFLAFFFDANNDEFVWDIQSGICNEYDFQTRQCLSIEEPKTFSKLVALIDFPTLLFIWVFTFCGSYFKSGNLVYKLVRASHLSKDAGELCACLGGVLIFWGVFHEAAMANAFVYVFMAYLYGHFTGIIFIAIVNYHRSKEEDKALN